MNKLIYRSITTWTTRYINATMSPRKPLHLDVIPGCNAAHITFSLSSNGGKQITNYQYSIDGGKTFRDVVPEQIDCPIVIDGLVNGKTYNIAIRAINDNGPGIHSDILSITPKKWY